MKDVQEKIVYTIVSLFLLAIVLLAVSGEVMLSLSAVLIGLAMRKVFRSKCGRKWWRTWCRIGLQFDKYLENRK